MINRISVEEFKKAVWPNKAEIIYSALAASLLVLIAVLPTFIVQINFLSARGALESEVGNTITRILTNIDGLEFTATVTTFVFWMIVGLIVYGLVSVMYTTLHAIEEDVEMSSDEYVHPQPFSRTNFWRQVMRESVLYIDCMVLIILTASITIFALLPAATTHAREMVVDFKPAVIISVIASLTLLGGGVWLLIQVVKIWHHRNLLLG